MVDHAIVATDFRVGQVLSRSFSTLFRNIVPFGVLALAISSPTYVYVILTGPPEIPTSIDPTTYLSEFGIRNLAVTVVDLLLGYLITAALVYGTIQDLKNEPAGLGECFAKGLVLVFPVIGVALVTLLLLLVVFVVTVVPGSLILGVIGAAIGSIAIGLLSIPLFLILLAPSIYVWIMLWVTIPVAVIERRGLGSLGRSMLLTKGYRWRIFFILLLILVIAIGIGLLMGAVAGISSVMAPTGGADISSTYFTAGVAFNWIMSAFISALSAVLVAVTYHDLRVAKEGVDTRQIAAVFD